MGGAILEAILENVSSGERAFREIVRITTDEPGMVMVGDKEVRIVGTVGKSQKCMCELERCKTRFVANT